MINCIQNTAYCGNISVHFPWSELLGLDTKCNINNSDKDAVVSVAPLNHGLTRVLQFHTTEDENEIGEEQYCPPVAR